MSRSNLSQSVKRFINGTSSDSVDYTNRLCTIVGGAFLATAAVVVPVAAKMALPNNCPSVPVSTFDVHPGALFGIGSHRTVASYHEPTLQEHVNHNYCIDRLKAEQAGGIMPSREAYETSASVINGNFVRSRELRAVLDAGQAGDERVRAFDGKNWYDLTRNQTSYVTAGP